MDIKTAFEFLEPHLKNYSQNERSELARLIEGKQEEPVKRKKVDPVPSEVEYPKKLIKWFKKKSAAKSNIIHYSHE